jgi:polyferredoxin
MRFSLDRSKQVELATLAAAIGGLAWLAWSWENGAPVWIYYAAIGAAACAGLTLYLTLGDFDQPLRRRLVQLLLGASLFGAAAFRDSTHALFQIEGLFFDLLSGVFLAAVLHYLIAKLLGPLLFGRVWCGWACWTAALLDQLPYKRSRGRLPGRWGNLRYLHLALSMLLVSALALGAGYRPGDRGVTALVWFLGGNALYAILGVALAVILKDNRAFCKYVCPVATLLKLSSQPAVLKIGGSASTCCEARVCEKVCPMDIKIADYITRGERVLCSECILCQACVSVCPEHILSISPGLDLCGEDLLHERR